MKPDRESYYVNAVSWARSRDGEATRSRNIAWIVAAVAIFIAFVEAVALASLAPLKSTQVVPVLVDRQTGYVQPLDPGGRVALHPDTALLRSLLAQYVQSREGFNITTLQHEYRKVMLWSSGPARTDYARLMPAANPASPLRLYPRNALVDVTVESVSDLSPTTALVRFSTARHDAAADAGPPGYYVAVMNYHFDTGSLSAADRLVNPLGFQVSGYQRSNETPPQDVPAPRIPPTAPQAPLSFSAASPRVTASPDPGDSPDAPASGARPPSTRPAFDTAPATADPSRPRP